MANNYVVIFRKPIKKKKNTKNYIQTTTTTKRKPTKIFYPNLIGIAPEATTTLDRVPQGIISLRYARVGVIFGF